MFTAQSSTPNSIVKGTKNSQSKLYIYLEREFFLSLPFGRHVGMRWSIVRSAKISRLFEARVPEFRPVSWWSSSSRTPPLFGTDLLYCILVHYSIALPTVRHLQTHPLPFFILLLKWCQEYSYRLRNQPFDMHPHPCIVIYCTLRLILWL